MRGCQRELVETRSGHRILQHRTRRVIISMPQPFTSIKSNLGRIRDADMNLSQSKGIKISACMHLVEIPRSDRLWPLWSGQVPLETFQNVANNAGSSLNLPSLSKKFLRRDWVKNSSVGQVLSVNEAKGGQSSRLGCWSESRRQRGT